MALTLAEQVRLKIGLVGRAYDVLSDDEINHYLTENNNNVNRTARACAVTACFIISQTTHTKASDLEDWGTDWFSNYYKTLQMFLKDPNFNSDILSAMPYAGGISKSDIRENINNPDNHIVNVDIGIPTDNIGCANNTDQTVFKKHKYLF